MKPGVHSIVSIILDSLVIAVVSCPKHIMGDFCHKTLSLLLYAAYFSTWLPLVKYAISKLIISNLHEINTKTHYLTCWLTLFTYYQKVLYLDHLRVRASKRKKRIIWQSMNFQNLLYKINIDKVLLWSKRAVCYIVYAFTFIWMIFVFGHNLK